MDSQVIRIMRMKSQLISLGHIPIHNLDVERPDDQEAICRIYDLWFDAYHKTSS